MRRAAKIDANQLAIVAALRARGWSVQSLAAVGRGCPDLLVGADGQNAVLEVKDGSKPPSARRLTPAQGEWHQNWNGQRAVVSTINEAIAAVEAVTGRTI